MSLKDIFYDPKVGLSSALAFMKHARQAGYSPKEITEFVKRQQVAQIHREARKSNINFFPNWGRGEGSYQMDFMFQYNPANRIKLLPILTIINVNSRKLYAYVLKSRNTSEVLKGLETWLKEVKEKPTFVQSDNEKAFRSRKVGDLLGEQRIIQSFVEPEDHRGQSIVERVHQTLRRLFTLYEDAFQKPWLAGFDRLVYNYNHRFHRSIGQEPSKASESAGMLKRQEQYARAQADFEKFKVGDKVRKAVFNKDKNKFDKGKTTWSERVYTIIGTNGYHLFQIDDSNKTFQRHYDLQRIIGEPEKFESNLPSLAVVRKETKKAQKVSRDIRKEGVSGTNITEAPREKQVAKMFVAEPAANPRTLDRSGLAPKKTRGSRSAPIVEYTQAKLGTSKFQFGKVFKEGEKFFSRYEDGQVKEYSPEELIQYRFPLTKADKKKFPSVVKRLLVPGA